MRDESSPLIPTVSTGTSTGVTSSGVTLHGYIISDGGASIYRCGFLYGTSPSNLTQNIASPDVNNTFICSISGLSSGTTYYYKAYAKNSAGTAYGEVMSFTTVATTGTLNGHTWVDLGLPSGTKWATCNVGANTSTAYGDYFAWGETTTKETYNSSTYTYSGNPTTLPSSADAATANWGSGWRMPTYDEMNELKNNCTHVWTTQNGVNGRKFTGPNGNSIFLPAAGERDSRLYEDGSYGYYWSSSLYTNSPTGAWYFNFNSGNCNMHNYWRVYGFTVRAVCNPR